MGGGLLKIRPVVRAHVCFTFEGTFLAILSSEPPVSRK